MLPCRTLMNRVARKGLRRSVVQNGLVVILAGLSAFALLKAGLGVTWSLAISCAAGTVALTWPTLLKFAHRTLSSFRRTIAITACRLTDRRTWQFSFQTLFAATLLLSLMLLAVICDCLLLLPSRLFWTVRVGATVAAIVMAWASLIALRSWAQHRFQFSIKALLLAFIPAALLMAAANWLLDARHNRLYHTSLQDAVDGFNWKASHDPVGRNQPPLTQAEVISAIRASLPILGPGMRTKYERIADSGYLPEGAEFRSITEFTPKSGQSRTVWWVNLEVSLGMDSGYGLRVREDNNPSASPEVPMPSPASAPPSARSGAARRVSRT